MLEEFLHEPRVAYFSMEIALRTDIPTYAGGLGVLAGDTMRSAADLALPLVAVSLVSRAGYFRQTFDASGRQLEQSAPWDPARHARQLGAKIAVTLEGRSVWIGAWLFVLDGSMGGRQPVVLLDTDLAENEPEDRELTHYLYGGDKAYRLKQEAVLGIGGARMLQALGFEISQYHLNEGHSALLGLELLRRFGHTPEHMRQGEVAYDIPRVREHCCFTTHTPIEAGHDRFSYELVRRVLGSTIDFDGGARRSGSDVLVDLATLQHLAGRDELNMTCLALNLSEYINGVAKRHAELSQKMFPAYRVHAITNGVHPATWTSESFRRLFDSHFPGWCHEPELLARVDCCIDDAAIAEAHAQCKRTLIARVHALTGVELQLELPILGYARRMTAYKRPDLLFGDLPRLRAIAQKRPFQIVLAGKAHPQDDTGKRLIEELHTRLRTLDGAIRAVYLPDYDLALAQGLVAGADVWVNTPLPPLEASGTSGMKAAFNGVPSLSVLDGWWIEGCIEGVTGWAIGSGTDDATAASLHDKLEKVILPLYYAEVTGTRSWVAVMKGAIAKNAAYFNSHRMMRRYATEAYLH